MILPKIMILFLLLSVVLSARRPKKKKPVLNKSGRRDPKILKLVQEVVTHLGSRTPYRFNANFDLSVDQNSECAKKIWMVIGQGTTYPSAKIIRKMDNDLPGIKMEILTGFAHRKSKQKVFITETVGLKVHRMNKIILRAFGRLPYEVIEGIDTWKPITTDTDNSLAPTKAGKNEIIALAKRMQSRYPHLFPKTFSNKTCLFKYCNDDAIRETTRAFARGLFGKEIRNVYFPPPVDRDLHIIRSHKDCPKWFDEVWLNEDIDDNIDEFYNSEYVEDAIENINKELGTNFNADEVSLLYTACAVESGCQDDEEVSPWCYIFNEKNIQPFEFVEDLEQYYRNGYGFSITSKIACLAVRDAVLFFNDRRNKRKANIYFTDNKAILHILANLGLYKTRKLSRKSFSWNSKNVWKSSKLAGFGTNLAIVYYACKDSKQLVGVLHNERFVKLPACKATHCEFSVFKKFYNKNINKCNYDKICETNE